MILNKLIYRNKGEPGWPEFEEKLYKLRTESSILALCPRPTGMNWLGIRNASAQLFGPNLLEVPQNYSQPAWDKKTQKVFTETLIELKFEQVILNGIHPWFLEIAETISPKTIVSFVFHGTLSEMYETASVSAFRNFINAGKNSAYRKVGFVRNGLAPVYTTLSGIPAYTLYLPVRLPGNLRAQPFEDGHIHIGILGGTGFNKNLSNQITAGLLVENSILHITSSMYDDAWSLGNRRIRIHEVMPREEYLQLLGKMHLNSYVCFSESWGQVMSESLALGVPCLASAYNSIFSGGSFPSELAVHSPDRPEEIAASMHRLLALKKEPEYWSRGIEELNIRAEQSLNEFLHS